VICKERSETGGDRARSEFLIVKENPFDELRIGMKLT
jgi:hypothetical protein